MSSFDPSKSDHAHVWHPYTRRSTLTDTPPPMIVQGDGCYLVADDGRRYFDAISSWWCCALGHSHPALVSAIRRQAETLQHSILGNLSHPDAARLAARLARLMPTPDRHVLFASDGSSAVEQALKIALQYFANTGVTGRTRFACIRDAYHGDTLGAMSVGYLDQFHQPFKSVLAPVVSMPFPSTFEETRRTLDPVKESLAAVIVEPLCLGAAGMKMYPATWLSDLAAWCKASGTLLIVDEIAMGFGRTGTMFAFEKAGIDPDLVCVGKALSGGYLPISATIAKDTIYQTFDDSHTLQHGHTFCGNPIACSAALAALDEFAKPGFLESVQERARVLQEILSPLAAIPRVKEVRCLGMIAAIELNDERSADGVALPHRIRKALLDNGILLRPLGNVIYLMPPLNTPVDDLRRVAGEVASAIRNTR